MTKEIGSWKAWLGGGATAKDLNNRTGEKTYAYTQLAGGRWWSSPGF